MTEGEKTDLANIGYEVTREHSRARSIHGPMHSLHEGYAVLKEEVDEFWDLVKMNRTKMSDLELTVHMSKIREELLQVSAMAQRLIMDVVDRKP